MDPPYMETNITYVITDPPYMETNMYSDFCFFLRIHHIWKHHETCQLWMKDMFWNPTWLGQLTEKFVTEIAHVLKNLEDQLIGLREKLQEITRISWENRWFPLKIFPWKVNPLRIYPLSYCRPTRIPREHLSFRFPVVLLGTRLISHRLSPHVTCTYI